MSAETTAEEQLEVALKEEASKVPSFTIVKGDGDAKGTLTYEGKVKSRKGKTTDSYRIYLGPKEPNFDNKEECDEFLAQSSRFLTLKKVAQYIYARLCAGGQAATDSLLPKGNFAVTDVAWDKIKEAIEQGIFQGESLGELYERQTQLNAEVGPGIEKALEAAEQSQDPQAITEVLRMWKEWRKEVQEITGKISEIKERAQKRKETKLANAAAAKKNKAAGAVVEDDEEEEEDEEEAV